MAVIDLPRKYSVYWNMLVAASLLALSGAITLALWDRFFSRVPFALFYAAVAVAAWQAGWLAGIVVGFGGVLLVNIHQHFAAGLLGPSVILCGVSVIVSRLTASREQAEKSLRRSDTRHSAILDAALDCIVSMDHKGRVIEWNPAAERTFGYSRTEALGREMAELIIPPQYRQAHYAGLAKYLSSGEGRILGKRLELTAVRRDGTEFPVELAITRVPLPGAPTFIGHLRDISVRVRTERERERLAAVVRNSPDFIGVSDLQGNLVSANPTALRMSGVDEEKLLRKPLVDYFAPDDRSTVIQTVLPAVVRDGRWVGELHLQNQTTGQLVPVLFDAFCIDDPATKQPTHIATITRDITEQKRSEAALHISQRRLNSLIDSNIIGIHVCDNERVLEANDAYLQMIGYSREDLQAGRLNWRALTPPEFSPRDDQSLEELKDRGACIPFEKQYIRKDGTLIPILLGIASLGEDKARFICLVQDLTQQKQAELERITFLEKERAARTEAERASQMKDEFLATLSHELRTPLNAILGWSQILKHGKSSEADLSEGLSVIERNARAQTQIIEDLLDMSRIISGKVRLDVHQMELADTVTASIETVRPAATTKGIRLQAVLDPLAHPVSGDPNRLQQVFWNLLSNAVKFTPKGGRVQVRLERVNSHVEVSVTDSGEGIAPEFLPFVFDRFRQADASTTRRHGGLGLGLSIVKQLVELHGGTVSVKSLGAGKGATFTVALPLTVIHPEPETLTARRHPESRALSVGEDMCVRMAGVRVLVVDDEPDARALVKRLLEDCQAVVVTAASASEAINRLQQEKFDVLVSDIGMPAEDGYALITQVRALPAQSGGTLPAIALTAYARSEDRVKSVVAGFQMHLAKPVEPTELIAMVASLAGRKPQKVS